MDTLTDIIFACNFISLNMEEREHSVTMRYRSPALSFIQHIVIVLSRSIEVLLHIINGNNKLQVHFHFSPILNLYILTLSFNDTHTMQFL